MINSKKETVDVSRVDASMAVEPEKVPTTEILVQGLDSIIPPSFSPIEDLKQVVNRDGVITMVSDQFLLLNAERLRNVLGIDTYNAYIASLSGSSPSPLSSLRSKMSDDDLLSSVKDRYIQHPSEIRSYIEGLDTHLQDLKRSIEGQLSDQPSSVSSGVPSKPTVSSADSVTTT